MLYFRIVLSDDLSITCYFKRTILFPGWCNRIEVSPASCKKELESIDVSRREAKH